MLWLLTAAACLALLPRLVPVSAAGPPQYRWVPPNQYFVPPVAFSGDRRYLAIGISIGPAADPCPLPTCEGRLHVWDLKSGACAFATDAKYARVMSLAFSHDNQYVIAGHTDGTVRVWSTGKWQLVQEFRCCSGTWIRAIAISPDDSTLAIGAQSGQIVLWNIAADLKGGSTFRGVSRGLPGHYYGVSSLAFDATGEYLLSAADDQHIHRWNVRTGNTYEFSRAPDKQKAHRGMVKAVALLNHDRWAVSGSYWEGGTTKAYTTVAPPDHILRLWDVDTGRPIRSYPLDWGVRCCIQKLGDGHRIAFLRATGWDENPVLEIFNLDTGQSEQTLRPSMGESFHGMAMHPDGSHFVISLGDGHFLVWDRRNGRIVAQLASMDEGWAVLAPDGRIDFSEGFARWPCRNNVQQACAGGATASAVPGLLARLWGTP